MAEETVPLESGETLSELEYYQRLQPAREQPWEVLAAFFAAFGSVLGLAAWYFVPFKLGAIAIACSIMALAMSGARSARIAFILAITGWLGGGLLAIALERKIW